MIFPCARQQLGAPRGGGGGRERRWWRLPLGGAGREQPPYKLLHKALPARHPRPGAARGLPAGGGGGAAGSEAAAPGAARR